LAFGNDSKQNSPLDIRHSPLEKPMASPELALLTPETAMRDAGIRKFVNPYGKKVVQTK